MRAEIQPTLFGRDAECSRLSQLLDAARGQRSGALVLTGEPGIGKSALCAWAVAHAYDIRLLSVHGVESELDLPFGGLSELCAGELALVDALPEPQRRALEGALARREAASRDRFAIGAAVLSLLAMVAERTSALVVVDDAQWIDRSSADALVFAARRLRSEGVALLVATRPGAVFDANRAGLPCMPLRGLDASAAHALLDASHGSLSTDVADLLVDRSAGNPLALREVPLMLSDDQLAGRQSIDEPLPVGPLLVRALLHRLKGLPAEARRALVVAAASGGERVQPVVAALSALGVNRGVLEPAEHAGVLSVAGERFEFHHPLLRSAIYHGATAPTRRAAHNALAQVTSGESHAWHLANATVGEDDAVAATLENAGMQARRRGAHATAAAALARAARLSPPGEPRVRRLTEAARDSHILGRPAAGMRMLDEALTGSHDTVQRADVQHLRGRILVLQGHIDLAYRLLVDEAHVIQEIDPDRAATMLAEACLHHMLSADLRQAIAAVREACRVAANANAAVQAFSGTMLAAALVAHGERAEASALLDSFLPQLRVADPLTEAGQLVAIAAQCYFWLERHDIASELIARLTTSARRASAPAALLLPLCCGAEMDFRAGRWAIADAQFQEAASLGQEMTHSVYAAYAFEGLARLDAAVGDEHACTTHAERALRLIDEHHNELGRLYIHAALGLLELGMGRVESALKYLQLARDLAGRNGIAEPNVVHWQADLIEAYIRAGRLDAAHEALDAFAGESGHTGGRWALGTAARCRGLLDQSVEPEACFGIAFEHLHEARAPFEIARTHLAHGEFLRRSGRRAAARHALRQAIDGFDELGATPWSTRAHAELRATGATARRRHLGVDPDQLTAHELQVARIVANGASNREAAAALFLSPKTIETHLAHIYRKLGVRSRTQLAAVSRRRGWLDEFAGAPSARTIADQGTSAGHA
jgi:DNA-binding CsgD family transcriptional regulator